MATPLAVAEMDYLVERRGGARARETLWDDLEAGAYAARWWADALTETVAIARRHPWLGLTDASLVALAGLLRTNRIADLRPTLPDHDNASRGTLRAAPRRRLKGP